MAHTPRKITLDGSAKALHPCRYCGGWEAIITPGKGPHAAGACERHIGWLGLDAAIALGLYERAS